jgi:hypothetical protein
MTLIESNSITRGVQDRIFVFKVLCGLMATQPSCVADGAAKSMLVVAHQGIAADRQGATVDRQSATVDCLSATVDRPGATVDHQGVISSHHGTARVLSLVVSVLLILQHRGQKWLSL